MFHIVIVSHGPMAEGLKASIEFIMGSVSDLQAICLDGDGIGKFSEKVKKYIEFAKEEETLVLSDIVHGSPYNEFAGHANDFTKDFDILAGVSVPVVLEALGWQTQGVPLKEAIPAIIQAGAVTSFKSEQSGKEENEEDE